MSSWASAEDGASPAFGERMTAEDHASYFTKGGAYTYLTGDQTGVIEITVYTIGKEAGETWLDFDYRFKPDRLKDSDAYLSDRGRMLWDEDTGTFLNERRSRQCYWTAHQEFDVMCTVKNTNAPAPYVVFYTRVKAVMS